MRVAIIGSGPTGFYAAEALLKRTDAVVDVDMFDRLPTPYGLVRGGVAPDHQKIKTVCDPGLRKPQGRFNPLFKRPSESPGAFVSGYGECFGGAGCRQGLWSPAGRFTDCKRAAEALFARPL